MKYVDVRHRCSSLLIEVTESVVFLTSGSCSSSLLPMTSSASAMGTFVKSEVTSKLTRILPSSSLMLLAFSTKSPESLTKVEVLPEGGEMMRVKNLAKLYVGESMLDTMGLSGQGSRRACTSGPGERTTWTQGLP